MQPVKPLCSEIMVVTFRRDLSPAFRNKFEQALDDSKQGLALGPTVTECLFAAGHTGVSHDGKTIYGFNPDGSNVPIWQLIEGLRAGRAFPGVVQDDTAVFQAAHARGLPTQSFVIRLPDKRFQQFKTSLDAERQGSQ